MPNTIAKGITVGTSNADVKAAIAGIECKETEFSTYYSYQVYPNGGLVNSYTILVDDETGLVNNIQIKHQPSYSDFTS